MRLDSRLTGWLVGWLVRLLAGWMGVDPTALTVLEEATSGRDRDELFEALQRRGIPSAPVYSAHDLIALPHLLERGMFPLVDHPVWGRRRITGLPWREVGDAPFTLQIIGVHDAGCHSLIFPEDLGLLEHGVHQGGLTMVDMGNDCYVPDVDGAITGYQGVIHSLIWRRNRSLCSQKAFVKIEHCATKSEPKNSLDRSAIPVHKFGKNNRKGHICVCSTTKCLRCSEIMPAKHAGEGQRHQQ